MKSLIRVTLVSLTILLFLMLAVLYTPIAAEDNTILSPQKFKVEITITYNSITLAEAAEKEAAVRNEHSKACEIKTEVESNNANFIVAIGTNDFVNVTTP